MVQSRFRFRLILILSICYLAACAPSSEKIAGQTATAERLTVAATAWATRSGTPTPAPETLYPLAEQQCEEAFNKNVVHGEVIIESASLLTLSIYDWESDTGIEQNWIGSWEKNDIAIPFLEAFSAQDVQFLLCIKEGRNKEGTYSDGGAAYRLTWSVRLVQWSDWQVIAESSFSGSAPPSTKPEGSQPGYGRPPGGIAVLKWLLPYWRESGSVLFHEETVTSIAFSPNGKVLAAGGRNNELKLWDLSSGEVLHTLIGHQGETISGISVIFSPDGSMLASGNDDDFNVKLWDVSSGEVLRTLSGHKYGVNSVTFSPDGRILASGSNDDTVKLWDITSGETLRTLSGHEKNVNSVAFSPDGSMLASGSDDNTVILWDLASGDALQVLSGHTQDVDCIAFSPDGDTLVSGSDREIILWDVPSGVELPRGWPLSMSHRGLTFSPDGNMLASAGGKDTVLLTDAATGVALINLSGHENQVTDVAFSPDGNLLASTSGGIVKLWDLTAMK